MMYLVQQESKAALSVVKKLCKQAKPGAIIKLTREEWAAWEAGYIIEVPDPPAQYSLSGGMPGLKLPNPPDVPYSSKSG